jgi:peptidoglycan glycosyltransferase
VNAGIRRVGAAMLVMFVSLVAQLTYLQVGRAHHLANDPGNARTFLHNIAHARGPILSADGAILATSVPADDEYKYLRVYPAATAELFAHVVGFQSIQFGSVGVERIYSDELAGRTLSSATGGLADVFATRQPVGTVALTLSKTIQQTARDQLFGRDGSVVVLDVHTGGIVAAYSNPTFDPNLLEGHNLEKVRAVRTFLVNAPSNPMLARSWRELYPPGSTFKTVTASIALQNHVDVDKKFPVLSELALPLTAGVTLGNFGNERCGGSLEDGFIVSCNTTFGQVGLDLGETFATGIQRFGIQTQPPPSDLDPAIFASTGPQLGTFARNQPKFAQAAIGQNQIAVTPLEMAMVAESVATGGVILEPHVLDCVKDPQDRIVTRGPIQSYRRAMDPAAAQTMRTFMLGVVNDPRGTGSAARIPGVQVAGKTGTAEISPGEKPHAWFIAFAPADHPRYAIAVFVDHGGVNGFDAEATGGRVAAPIARQVLEAALAVPATPSQCDTGK